MIKRKILPKESSDSSSKRRKKVDELSANKNGPCTIINSNDYLIEVTSKYTVILTGPNKEYTIPICIESWLNRQNAIRNILAHGGIYIFSSSLSCITKVGHKKILLAEQHIGETLEINEHEFNRILYMYQICSANSAPCNICISSNITFIYKRAYQTLFEYKKNNSIIFDEPAMVELNKKFEKIVVLRLMGRANFYFDYGRLNFRIIDGAVIIGDKGTNAEMIVPTKVFYSLLEVMAMSVFVHKIPIERVNT